jgi:hypothetical protein
MSDKIGGGITYGKEGKKVTVEFKGKLTKAEWEEFKERLKELVKHYGNKISVTGWGSTKS